MIIGITGTLGAGKGTVVEYLQKKGFKHYSVRAFLIEEIKRRGLPNNRDSMVAVANDLREKHSPSYLAEQLFTQAQQEEGDIIIESLRTPGEVKSLQKNSDFILMAVDADPKIRYERITSRGLSTDHVDFETFIAQEKREMTSTDPTKQNLSECISLADVVFTNNGSLEELYKHVQLFLDSQKNSKEETVQEVGDVLVSQNSSCQKRTDYISWDEYFMGVAMLSAMRSKDPSTQVGACIVTPEKKIVGMGYNGWPRGIADEDLPWGREGPTLETKYVYVVHAEQNAILNSTQNLKNCTIYVALFPCNECAKNIIQSGIKEVVYISDKYAHLDIFKASRKMLTMAGVILRQFVPERTTLVVDFEKVNK